MLAAAQSTAGQWLVGTRDALYLPGAVRLVWEALERAEWDQERECLRIVEVGDFGQPRGIHEYVLAEPALLLQLVRERITASVVLQRRVDLERGLGFTVVARRPPAGGGLTWAVEYDPSVDPEDPVVAEAVDEAVAAARGDVGG